LFTRWTSQVRPETVHPEYPRPQMVREAWRNLNGLWDYAVVATDAPQPSKFDGKILVPFPIESALSGVGKRLDETSRLWYRRSFVVPKDWNGKRILLHFGAVDWDATVWVNGKQVGSHRGGYDPFRFDITDALKPGGSQELVVAVWDPTADGQAKGKQVRKPRGIWYTPSSGIWQTVWLEPVAATHLETLRIVPLFDESAVEIRPTIVGAPGSRLRLQVDVLESDRVIRSETFALELPGEGDASKRATPSLRVPVPDFKPWSPDSPFLYDLRITVIRDGQTVDRIGSYFGMRKISIGPDARGITRILLNNRFVFQIGFLDQGFWPDGLYTAPTDEALRFDIEFTKKLGMNMARKHVKVEMQRWYYWCDRLGLLVWQDMPSMAARRTPTPESRKQFELELKRLIETHINHPSIVMWIVFNEGWGQYDTERLVMSILIAVLLLCCITSWVAT
ncbi:MAG TPA: glycoside hydrolase family 2, partial [Planctomycetaceae bacterium]|nr:glycoside hydrolase family 2 [Planctomycetaceae bacterium]